jgi:uncharacterized protein with HEPN domain
MSKREYQLYLQDILDCIDKIETYTTGMSFEAFDKDAKTIDAVVRNIEIIGEAARNIPKDLVTQTPEIPWRRMSDTRNRVLHEYFGVDTKILWQTITEDLPPLKEQIKHLLES